MISGGIAVLAAMVVQPVGAALAWVAWAFLEFTIAVVQWTAQVPWATIDVGRLEFPLLALYYVGLLGITQIDRGKLSAWLAALRTGFSVRPALALGVVLVLAMWLGSAALTAPDGKTHIEFLDAGGASTLIRTPGGAHILVDGGANPSAVVSALGDRMPFWERSLDLVVLTSADDGHIAGLVPVLDRFDVRQVIQPAAPSKPSASWTKWEGIVSAKHIATTTARSGLTAYVDRDVALEFLYPPEDAAADTPAVVRVRSGNQTFLFADSAGVDDQSVMIESGVDLSSAFLVAPRKLAPGFFEAVTPQCAILFAGNSTRDQPPAGLLDALATATVFTTEEHGTIEFIVYGETIAVRTER